MGDARLNRRLCQVIEAMASDPMASIPNVCGGGWAETKAAYRLLDNDRLDFREVLRAHSVPILERIRQQSRVLCLQDTTELDYSGRPSMVGLGRLNYEQRQGLYLHPTLAISEAGVALGVADCWHWARLPKGEPDLAESLRWVEGYERVAELAALAPETRLVYVADREGDLRALIDRAEQLGFAADYLIRVRHDRKLNDPLDGKLRAAVEAQPVLGTIAFDLPANGNRPARQVTQTLRVARLELKTRNGPGPKVTVILAWEEAPPEGREAVEWCLITNEPITTLEQARARIEWYRKRWWIEVYFRILKSGCRIEALQLRTRERLERALVLYLIVAWRILMLMTLGREHPEWCCEVVFSVEEWQTAWAIHHRTPPPSKPPDLGTIVRLVAGFGGWLGRKNDPPPGPKALWQGMTKLSAYVEAVTAIQTAEIKFPKRKRIRH
nr:IS4 family transposase [Methylomarinovum sp. IN45]